MSEDRWDALNKQTVDFRNLLTEKRAYGVPRQASQLAIITDEDQLPLSQKVSFLNSGFDNTSTDFNGTEGKTSTRKESLLNYEIRKKNMEFMLGNRASAGNLKDQNTGSNCQANKYERYLTSIKRADKQYDSPVTDVVRFYRSNSRDSKQEVGGMNSTIGLSGFGLIDQDAKSSQNLMIVQDEEQEDRELELGATKMDNVNRQKLKQLKVSYI